MIIDFKDKVIRNVPRFRVPARAGVRKRTEGMNKLETAYAEELNLKPQQIAAWWYEGMRLRLGTDSWYKPDFVVQLADGTIEMHETKGHWREAARVRIKVAAGLYPFRFVAITRKKGEWIYEEIKP